MLSDRVRGVQLRWRETLAEPSPGPLAAALPPEGFAERPCAGLYGAASGP